MQNSSRLQYRLFDVSNNSANCNDKQELWEIDQDPEVMRYITGGVITSWKSLETVFIPRIMSYTNADKGYGVWRVALANTDEFIGQIIVRPMHFFNETPHFHDIELGWRFKRAFWGQGYATEAAVHLMQYMAQRPEVTHISAIAEPENTASTNIMQKLGMKFIHHGIHSDPLGDMAVDLYRKQVFKK